MYMEPNDVVMDSVTLPERVVDISGEIADDSQVESDVVGGEVAPVEAAPTETGNAPKDTLDVVLVGEPASVPVSVNGAMPVVVPTQASTERRVYTMEDRLQAKEVRRQVTETMLAGIMTYAADKRDALADLVSPTSELVGITNDEVETHCAVSDTTAGKYLRELVSRGLLVKRGTGRGTRYEVV
jgi:hypothetical protein